MAQFSLFFPLILKNEGGYANIPGDSGKITYIGISRANYPNWKGWSIVDANQPLKWNQIINDPTLNQYVQEFYKAQEWDTLQADQINNQSIADFLVDWATNAGTSVPVKHAQLILKITEDGKVGQQTISAINAADAQSLFNNLKAARLQFYQAVVANNPNDAKFLPEWERRTNSFVFTS